jgi:alpha-tubulin suppressor-like RCC1 family protein
VVSPQLAAGDRHTCAITAGGRLSCWGDNSYGEIGNATPSDPSPQLRPVPIPHWPQTATVSAGGDLTCAIPLQPGSNGPWCWGRNSYLGGDGGPVQIDPSSFPDGTTVSVATGYYHACGLNKWGGIWCWGSDYDGQLGDGRMVNGNGFLAATSFPDVAAQVTANTSTCALGVSGSVWCCGDNGYGELGNGTYNTSAAWVQPTGLGSNVAEISTGADHTCARKTDGTVWCWGTNYDGQLGDGTRIDRLSPIQVTALGSATQISAGGFHTCAVETDGSLWCWGYGSSGQLGDGAFDSRALPFQVAGLGGPVIEVSCGDKHTCARTSDGRTWCWGDNSYGQLGNGTTTNSASPVLVALPTVPASGPWSAAALCALCAAIAAFRLESVRRSRPATAQSKSPR